MQSIHKNRKNCYWTLGSAVALTAGLLGFSKSGAAEVAPRPSSLQLSSAPTAIQRSPYGVSARPIFFDIKPLASACTSVVDLDLKQELSTLRGLYAVSGGAALSIDDSVDLLQSKFESRSTSVPDLREGVRQLWFAVVWSGYRGLDGEISNDVMNLLDLPWGMQGTLFTQNRLQAQLDYYKSIGYRPVITDVVRQKLNLLDAYDARLTQLIVQQNLTFQSIADKTNAFANCRIQKTYPRISVDLKSILNSDSEPNLTIEKYAPNGLLTNWNTGMTSAITYVAQPPTSLVRGLLGGSASFLASNLFGKVMNPRTFNLNGVKPDLIKYGLQSEFQNYVLTHGAFETLPGLSYSPINFDPFGQQLMASLLGQILSANAGNAEVWSSIQRLGINYSVNVFKQRLLASCGASCQTLNHLSIVQTAVGLSQTLEGNPALGEGNYNEVLSQFKMRVVNQNLLVRVRSEARAQSLFYFATRILVSRKWMDSKWFPYARNSGLVQVTEANGGQTVSYAGLMDMDGVLQTMLYFDGPVAHALEASASPMVAAYFQKLAGGIQQLPSTIRDENEIFQIIGQRGDLFKQISDDTNQVFANGFLID